MEAHRSFATPYRFVSAANIGTILNIRKHNQQNFILIAIFIDFIC